MFILSLSLFRWQMMGSRMVVADRLGDYPCPWSLSRTGGMVDLGRGERHPKYFWGEAEK